MAVWRCWGWGGGVAVLGAAAVWRCWGRAAAVWRCWGCRGVASLGAGCCRGPYPLTHSAANARYSAANASWVFGVNVRREEKAGMEKR